MRASNWQQPGQLAINTAQAVSGPSFFPCTAWPWKAKTLISWLWEKHWPVVLTVLNKPPPSLRLTAAFSATVECLDDPSGLEHEALGERIRHFTQRLSNTLRAPEAGSPMIDRLFLDEACEQLENMRAALAALPVDAYTLAHESAELSLRAEQLEQWQILLVAQAITRLLRQSGNQLDQGDVHQRMSHLLDLLAACLRPGNAPPKPQLDADGTD